MGKLLLQNSGSKWKGGVTQMIGAAVWASNPKVAGAESACREDDRARRSVAKETSSQWTFGPSTSEVRLKWDGTEPDHRGRGRPRHNVGRASPPINGPRSGLGRASRSRWRAWPNSLPLELSQHRF